MKRAIEIAKFILSGRSGSEKSDMEVLAEEFLKLITKYKLDK